MKPRSDLIYDVGLFDGGDTAYYLFRGYNVVAIDANPLMIERARTQFAKEIQQRRLTLLNLGISQAPGTATFWISEKPEWSSFDRVIASRNGTGHSPVSIPTVPFVQILEEYGIPHYLKIDIEGNDWLCVDALKGMTLPKYISVESECVGDSAVISDEEAIAMLESLWNVGYRRFKLMDQSELLPVRPSRIAHFGMRLMTSLAQGRLRAPGLSVVAKKFTDSGQIAALRFGFPKGSSGPWGEDIPGGWMPLERAKSVYLRERRSFFVGQKRNYSFWYDWHATF